MNSALSTALPPAGLELEELLAELGPETLVPLAPHQQNRRVMGADFFDASEPLPDEPGLLLLAPSAAGFSAEELHNLSQRAARQHAAAIAVKCADSEIPRFERASEVSGIPFLRVSDSIGWRLFDALLTRLLGEWGRGGDLHTDRKLEPLFALANELAGVFGGSVAIEDLGRSVVAYSSVPGQAIDSMRTQGILLRRVPDTPYNDLQYEEVLRAGHPIKYPGSEDEAPRVAFPIRVGTLPLGSIWAIDAGGDGPISGEQEQAMKRAAATAASFMLDDIRYQRAGQLPREERLRTLLDGHSVMGSELLELGIPRERDSVLLVFDPPPHEPLSTLSQLRSTVRRHLSLHHPEAITAVRDRRVFALMEGTIDSATSISESLLPILDRLIAPGTRVALPGSTRRATEVAQLRELAGNLLEVAPVGTKQPRLLSVEKLRPLLLLGRLGPFFDENSDLREPALDRLRNEHPEIADTLLTWCAAFGNIALAARRLGVHENTVRYRLQRVQDIQNLDLDDPDTRLATWLQLRTLHRRAE